MYSKNFIITLIVLISISVLPTYAAFGDPDLTFGTNGNRIDFAEDFIPQRTAIQSDGKILVAGYRYDEYGTVLILRRYNSNGSVDTSYGSSGTAIPYNIYGEADDLLIQANGKAVVVGYFYPPSGSLTVGVWRFNTDGWFDSSFASTGRKSLENGISTGVAKCCLSRGGSETLLIGLDDKIVALQSSNGAYSTSFGVLGTASVPFTAAHIGIKGSSIYAVGRYGFDSASAAGKYTLSGQPDTTFGSQGVAIASNLDTYGCQSPPDLEFLDEGYERLAFQSDGKLVAGGYIRINKPLGEALPISYRTLLNRHELNGAFDLTFTSPCDNIFSFFASGDSHDTWTNARSVAVEKTDQILASAWGKLDVGRFSQSGSLVDSFQVQGGTSFVDKVLDVVVQPDGKILVSTLRRFGSSYYNQLSQHMP
jgi:uncharacterized delta-60 repeat protein